MIASTAGWVIKTAIGVANLITFGALTRNEPGYTYLEGFWCAIISVILSGITSIFLLCHLTMRKNSAPDEEIKFEGRTFICSELALFGLIALEALIFSKIEGWTYLTGIYFTIVSLLSIGFGDYSPTHASTKVLLFPFAIAGIVLLSNQISLIAGVASKRISLRKKRFDDKASEFIDIYAAQIQGTRKHHHHNPSATDPNEPYDSDSSLSDAIKLKDEIHRLHRLAEEAEAASQLLDLFWSGLALALFWVVGSIMFHYMEGWGFGDSFYFSYVFFLTIGFGGE